MDFQAFINKAIADNPIEAKLVRKVVRALAKAGHPVSSVWDGVETTSVRTERDIMEQVFNLDEAFLQTEDDNWVRLTMGNEWDVITDYTTDLEAALQPVSDYIDKHQQ
jgi:hypothetical protein